MARLLLVAFLSAVFSIHSFALESRITGKIRSTDPEAEKPEYTYERVVTDVNGHKEVKASYKNLAGKELVTEWVSYNSKGKVKSYRMLHHQIGEDGTVEFKNGKLEFTLKKKDGTVEHETEDQSEHSSVIDEMVTQIYNKWTDIIEKEEDLDMDLAIISRKDTVGIKIFKDEEIEYEGKKAYLLKMKPRSFIIAMFVKPMYFVFEKGGDHRPLEIRGRLPIKHFSDPKNNPDDYNDILGDLKLEY